MRKSVASLAAAVSLRLAPLSAPAPDLRALDTRLASARKGPAIPAFLGPAGGIYRRIAAPFHARKALERPLSADETLLRADLVAVYEHLVSDRPQQALALLEHWEAQAQLNLVHRDQSLVPYQESLRSYHRLLETALRGEFVAIHERALDGRLAAEARGAEGSQRLIGHPYRPTALQKDRDSCVQSALENARAAAAIERPALPQRSRVHIKEAAAVLGAAPRPLPSSEAELQDLMRAGQEIILHVRTVHDSAKFSDQTAEFYGHRYPVLEHAAYLLGTFFSEAEGRWLYMVQDSGWGATEFYTWPQLRRFVPELYLLR